MKEHAGYVPLLAHILQDQNGKHTSQKVEKKGKITRITGYVELTHHTRIRNGKTSADEPKQRQARSRIP